MRKTVIGILIFALASCTGSVEPIQPTPLANQTTIASTATPKPLLATVIPDSETEGSSLKDIKPTPIPENTPIPLSDHYDLPIWMKYPETNIVAALITNDLEKNRKIAFFNAATGEKYEILMPQNISGYFWYDNTNFGFLATNLKATFRLDLTTGQVTSETTHPQSVRLLEPDWTGWLNGLNIAKKSPSSLDFTFTSIWKSAYSKNATYTASFKPDQDGITIINNITNETIWEFTTPAETYITEFSWSPADNNILAYIQGKPDFPSDLITKEITLNIIDISEGKLLATYSGDFGRINWSPDGKAILYQNSKSNYSNYGVGFTEAPCILFLNSSESKCIRSIPKVTKSNYNLASTGNYEWSADGRSIFYVYLYESPEDHSYITNLCIYSLLDSHINCPTDGLKEIEGQSGIGYSPSPSYQYIYLCISDSSMLNDYAGTSKDGITKIDGTGFFSWIGTIRDDAPSETCSFDTLWRPLP
jgi:hypothetical protein